MCGIAAVINKSAINTPETFYLLAGILAESENRGEQASGVALYSDCIDRSIQSYRGLGVSSQVFNQEAINKNKFSGSVGIGHNRYATSGVQSLDNTQPLEVNFGNRKGFVAINGEVSEHVKKWRLNLISKGADFGKATSDSSTILGEYLYLYSQIGSPMEALKELYGEISDFGGTTAVGIIKDLDSGKDHMIYLTDGLRPMHSGSFEGERGEYFVISSEDAPIRKIGGDHVRSVPGGTVGIYDLAKKRLHEEQMGYSKNPCVFEYIYYRRPESMITDPDPQAKGKEIHITELRRRFGAGLRKEHPPKQGCIVAGVPNSGLSCARNYDENHSPQEIIVKNKTSGPKRIFISSQSPEERVEKAKRSFSIVEDVNGKCIILVDDSIVRYTNLAVIVQALREAGAREVYLAIGSPPIVRSCHSGIDTHMKDLIASQFEFYPEDIAEDHSILEERLKNYKHPILGEVKVDGVFYLTREELERISGKCCTGCLGGPYEYHYEGMEEHGAILDPVERPPILQKSASSSSCPAQGEASRR